MAKRVRSSLGPSSPKYYEDQFYKAKYGMSKGDYEMAQAAKKAKQANEQRYEQGMGIFDEIIQRYQPGGEYGKGAMALYEQGKSQAMAQGMQNLVSSGLSNTTVAAGLPMKYEQEVGTPFRMQLEDRRMDALTQAQIGKTGFIERRQDVYPDANLYAGLQTQASSGGGGGTRTTYNRPTRSLWNQGRPMGT
jgi:hypothetical protein